MKKVFIIKRITVVKSKDKDNKTTNQLGIT